ncbi:MAG TPA: hypothetical protein VE177_04295, partial [Candidatus Binatus sp.]|nr:hypothetical protein [Candidatus Binatus sp.]
MVRLITIALLFLILPSTSLLVAQSYSQPVTTTSQAPAHSPDPFGAATAFNTSYALTNLYDNTNATCAPTSCSGGGAVTQPNGREFKVLVNSVASGSETINWTVPVYANTRGCTNCNKVILRFRYFTPTGDRIDSGSNASYAIYRGKLRPPGELPTRLFGSGTSQNDSLSIPLPTSSVAGFCPGADEFCFDATASIGYNVTLMFTFKWQFTATGKMLSAQVGSVSALAPYFTNANLHMMSLMSPSIVGHTANVTFNYNMTVTTNIPSDGTHDFTWSQLNITLYYPTAYTLFQVSNSSGTLPSPTTAFCKASDCKLFNVTASNYV